MSVQQRQGDNGASYPKEAVRPPKNIAKLPAQLFDSLKGSLTNPNRLPIMSAKPSPPHIMETAINPAGLSLQKTRATDMRTMQ